VKQARGLIVTTTFWDRDRYMRGNLCYDLAKAAMNRLAFGMAEELRPHGVASLALSPGWMRTEFVLAGHLGDLSPVHSATGQPVLRGPERPHVLDRAEVLAEPDDS
jgi:NAD(P)-dependent dehydrogenase (short-subunit alcohol dehydrogenase family)